MNEVWRRDSDRLHSVETRLDGAESKLEGFSVDVSKLSDDRSVVDLESRLEKVFQEIDSALSGLVQLAMKADLRGAMKYKDEFDKWFSEMPRN